MTGSEKWARPAALIDKWEGHLPWLMALAVSILYVLTMSPTVGHTDAGELSAAAYTFGVAHPTGYPLFTLLGWLFTRIPVGTVALRLNFMCLLFVSGSVYAWARFLREFFVQMKTTVKKGDSSYAFRIKLANLLSTVVGTTMLCFGRTWWAQATGTEVYSLQCLLLVLMLWALLRAWFAKEDNFLRWAIFAVSIAMCFTNHLTAIVLLPGALYMYFVRWGINWASIKQGLGLAGIAAGILVVFYGIMMLVAQSEPTYNWGNPADWPRLWHQMRGKQFSVFMFQGPKQFGINLLAYLNRLPNELGWDLIWPKIPIWIGLGGMVFQGTSYSFERRREWSIFFALGFFANIFWAANYTIKDPEPYFLFSFIVIAFLGAMLLRWAWIGAKKFAIYFTALFAIVIGFQVFWNFGAVNQRDVHQYEDYARAMLSSLPQNAIVITNTYDVITGPVYYLQGCEGFRKDVMIVDYPILRSRHWYPTHIRSNDPKLAAALGTRLDDWEKAVSDFDIKGKVRPEILSPRFDAVYYGILQQMLTRPVYFSPDFCLELERNRLGDPKATQIPPTPPGVLQTPERYLVRLSLASAPQAYSPLAAASNEIRFGGDEDEYENRLLNTMLSQAWSMRAAYENANGHATEAAALQAMVARLGPTLSDTPAKGPKK